MRNATFKETLDTLSKKVTDAPDENRVEVTQSGDFRIGFAYDPTLVGEVKQIPGRRFDGATKTWKVPATAEAIGPLLEFVSENHIDFSLKFVERTQKLIVEAENAAAEAEEKIEASRAADADIKVEGLGGELRPFQRAGVDYAVRTQRTFIADEMGLGKTVQALATVQATDAFPALVVCPASLKLNWKREAEKWLPGKSVAVLNGKDCDLGADIVVVNYDILHKHAAPLKARGFAAIILDESHYTKNHKAKRTKLCRELAKDIPIRLLLSGTPLVNRPQELISQLGILGKLEDFGGFWNFASRYCEAHKDRFGWDFSGAAHLDELNQKLRATCYVRRTKEEVLKELPAKQRAVLPVSLSNRGEYEKAERELIRYVGEAAENDERRISEAVEEWTEKHGREPGAGELRRIRSGVRNTAEASAERAEQLVRIETLKSTAARGKLEEAFRWIEDFLESGEKLVVFGWHKEIVDALSQRFGAPKITGDVTAQARQAAVDAFQEDAETRLLVCNIRAGGVGLTLTAASNVAFIELGWTPAEHDQAEDRTHRIGQTDSVTAWYLLASDTIDEEIHALIEAKRGVVDAATEGIATASGTGVMAELTDRLRGRKEVK